MNCLSFERHGVKVKIATRSNIWVSFFAVDGGTLPYLTLPYLRGGCRGTPAMMPQFGPNAQARQTSWSKKSLRGFCKFHENCPVDTAKSVQWECVITEDRSSEQHCGTALSNEMNWSFLLILAKGTYRFIAETHDCGWRYPYRHLGVEVSSSF